MKRVYVSCLFVFVCLHGIHAQMKKMEDVETFMKRVAETAASVKSIESDFTQVKHLDLFDEDITSKGTFYYRYEEKICLDYYAPSNYLIVINADKLKIVSEGKKNVVDLKSNLLMGEMRRMLAACLSGHISRITGYGYELAYFEDAVFYIVKIKPLHKSLEAYISGFDIYMDKKDMSVARLRVSENATDYTDYLFHNKKFNTLADDEKFAVN